MKTLHKVANAVGRRGRPLWLSLVLLFVMAAPAASQAVQGYLLERDTRRPIGLGSIVMIDTAGTIVDDGFSAENGFFRLRAPAAGKYYLRADRVGFRSMLDGPISLVEERVLEIEFHLPLVPVAVDSLTAQVDGLLRRYLEDMGFYDRLETGQGRYITPEEIDRMMPLEPKDLLRGISFIGIRKHQLYGTIIEMRRWGSPCEPHVFVDGSPHGSPRDNMPLVLDNVVDVREVEAVEIYDGPAQLPSEYASFNTCGALLFWTARG